MKIITLSDHIGDKLQEFSDGRNGAKTYQDAVRSEKRWWFFIILMMLLVSGLSLYHYEQKAIIPLMCLSTLLYVLYRINRPLASDLKEIIWQKGAEGEQAVQDYLRKKLDDTWVLLCGYKNRKGEIDQILVGETGVFALEVKFLNGDIYCDGKKWSRNKYDRYGNLVERNLPITDKNGRCPACQVNESADDLEIFLNQKMGYASAIKRAVILAHPSCRVKEIKNPTVDMMTTLKEWDLRTFLAKSSVTLNKKEVHHIVRLIGQDHAFHHSKQGHRRKKRA